MNYRKAKNQIRRQAVEFQSLTLDGVVLSPYDSEYLNAQEYFGQQAKRYGLAREFKENAISDFKPPFSTSLTLRKMDKLLEVLAAQKAGEGQK